MSEEVSYIEASLLKNCIRLILELIICSVCSPVSKCLAVLVGGFHVASHVPALESFFRKIVTGID